MNYVYDIVLNFQFSDRLLDFYEWSSSDYIEHIKKIPIFRVEYNDLFNISNNITIISKNFIDKVFDLTITYDNNKINNCFLLTDLNRVYAFLTDSNGKVIAKSSLLLDEEEDIINECMNISVDSFEYKMEKEIPSCIFLTRNEEFIRNFLINEINRIYLNKEYDELIYFYNEIFLSDSLTINDKFNKLIFEIKNNFNDKFNVLYEIIKTSQKNLII